MHFAADTQSAADIHLQVELKSDLSNLCLVSRAVRDFAIPRFYREIWDASSHKHSNETRTETLLGFLQLPSQILESVRKIKVKSCYPSEEYDTSVKEMLDAIKSLIARTTRLEAFKSVDTTYHLEPYESSC